MFLLILCGAGWRLVRPAGLDGDQTRQVLTAVVYYLFLPALILKLMSRAELGGESLRISLFGFLIMTLGGLLAAIYLFGRRVPARQAGAVWLAVSFPNVTFLGLPILLETFGDWAALLVIQLDLFAFTPLVLTVGVSAARAFGSGRSAHPANALLRVPPLWAAVVAIGVNVSGEQWSPWLLKFFDLLAQGVTPLMLLSLGLALDWQGLRQRFWSHVLVVVVLRLLFIPLLATWLVGQLGFSGATATALVMEAGMPSMLFGIVLCDRFGLDSRLYAVLVTVTTLLAVVTLPLWYRLTPVNLLSWG
ncbi:MAG TPA: AEC family transporter [Methylothermaceae bacterium]|nr:AEC family transporter [Methylothermaceae bacterium]